VAVLDSGRTASGRPFIVTELLAGETLADYAAARGGALPVAEALELVLQILAGLTVVHEAGFVHRDLKLANLFVLEAPPGERRHLKVLLIDLDSEIVWVGDAGGTEASGCNSATDAHARAFRAARNGRTLSKVVT
jgi:serine/threonine-protein kinase